MPPELQRIIQDYARPIGRMYWRQGCYCNRFIDAFKRQILINAYLIRYKLLYGNTLLQLIYG